MVEFNYGTDTDKNTLRKVAEPTPNPLMRN